MAVQQPDMAALAPNMQQALADFAAFEDVWRGGMGTSAAPAISERGATVGRMKPESNENSREAEAAAAILSLGFALDGEEREPTTELKEAEIQQTAIGDAVTRVIPNGAEGLAALWNGEDPTIEIACEDLGSDGAGLDAAFSAGAAVPDMRAPDLAAGRCFA